MALDKKKRAILQRILGHVSDQETLTYGDTPSYNDHSGSGFFPDYKIEATEEASAEKASEDAKPRIPATPSGGKEER